MTPSSPRLLYLFVFCIVLVIILFRLNGINQPTPIEFESDDAVYWGPTAHLRPLSYDPRNRLFNISFKYLISATPCTEADSLAVIVVTSHFNNVETRSAMRRAFPREDLAKMGLKRVFLLGEIPDNVYIKQAAILDESKRFGDVIQGTFIEAYRNLTYKHIMGLKWASENCNLVKYFIKMDDDIVINVRRIVSLLDEKSIPNNVIAGYVLRNMVPIREPANKWYVTLDEYRYSKYPSFVSGWLYVTTPRIATKIVLLSHYSSYFWIDDVYVTGVLANKLKLRLYDLKKFYTTYPEFLQCCIMGVRKRENCDVLVGPNGGDNNLFFEFNQAMEVCGSNQCEKRKKPLKDTCVAERKINLQKGDGVIEKYKLH